MPKRREGYDEWMERLNEQFPGRELIRKCEVAGWLGVSKQTLMRRYNLPPGQYVSKVALAREVCGS